MKAGRLVNAALVPFVLACSMVAGPAVAQVGSYSCNVGGSVYVSRAPCPNGAGAGTSLNYYGPARDAGAGAYNRNVQVPGRAEAHVLYLGPECARISEGIRTGPTRGVPYNVIAELRSEYGRKCQEEDQRARATARDDDARQRKDRAAAYTAEQGEKAEVARNAAQCDEMLRALAGRRRRVDTMTPGEKQDLERFQITYDQRCKQSR